LRGRVGRSNQQSYCILLPSADAAAAAVQRLQHLVQHHDGLKLKNYCTRRVSLSN